MRGFGTKVDRERISIHNGHTKKANAVRVSNFLLITPMWLKTMSLVICLLMDHILRFLVFVQILLFYLVCFLNMHEGCGTNCFRSTEQSDAVKEVAARRAIIW